MDPDVGGVPQLDNYRFTVPQRHTAALGCWCVSRENKSNVG